MKLKRLAFILYSSSFILHPFFSLPLVADSGNNNVYIEPPGGWAYIYSGDTASPGADASSNNNFVDALWDALDGTWDHINGYDEWDGTEIGSGSPGGAMILAEGDTNFIRIQDTGDPRDHSLPDPSNRKVYFAHQIADDIGEPNANDILDNGITISFRARISTQGPLDPMYPDTNDSLGSSENPDVPGGSPWPIEGNGYLGHNRGIGNFSIYQSGGEKIISFSLALDSESMSYDSYLDFDDPAVGGKAGLVMNSLADLPNSTIPNEFVDPWDNEGALNFVPLLDPTQWHEFWITIEQDESGIGTHLVKVYLDGSDELDEFLVTAGNNVGYEDSFLGIGTGSTAQMGALDIDFFAYSAGVFPPNDSDCNGNGIPDTWDITQGVSQDCNNNGIPDECDIASGTSLDCNGNGIPDECDIASGTSLDCNGNGIPDECDITDETSADVNGNGIPDECEDCNGNGILDPNDIYDGTSQDCNGNGIPDECDIADETSADVNGNGIPDECEPDCNNNGIPDEWDIYLGTSQDCNGNGIPDECETDCNGNGIPDECDISGGISLDCNGNGIPDECDIAQGTSQDCNGNGIPDECDIAGGTSQDVNGNGIPDECESDCNGNGIPDDWDISTGTSQDCNINGIPDECDIAFGTSLDNNLNNIPDECEDPNNLIISIERRNSVNTPPEIAPNPLGEGELCYVEGGGFIYVEIPSELVGMQYVKVADSDSNNPNYELDITLAQPAILCLFLSNILGHGSINSTPDLDPDLKAAGMDWVLSMGFIDTGLNMKRDWFLPPNDQCTSIYAKRFPTGTVTLYEQNDLTYGGKRMYGVGALLGSLQNIPPEVDAGDFQKIVWPNHQVQLDATVMGGSFLEWSKFIGPGSVQFLPNNDVENPSAVFDSPGIYRLQLKAWDDLLQEGKDLVTIWIEDPTAEPNQVGFPEPTGGWDYIYTGDNASPGADTSSDNNSAHALWDALDGTWDHINRYDEWDGTEIGSGMPGGAMILTEEDINFIRIQDTGDPRDHSLPNPSNCKVYFAHRVADDIGDTAAASILDDGITLSFRARIATQGPLDPMYPDISSSGENHYLPAGTPWPAGGNGYLGHDRGIGNFSIYQSGGEKIISFSLALGSESMSYDSYLYFDDLVVGGEAGLVMNSLADLPNSTIPNEFVDPWDNEGTLNFVPQLDPIKWHEFWITIEAEETSTGTHLVKVYLDGSEVPDEFLVTAGTAQQYDGSYIGLGLGAIPQMGAFDIDFIAYKAGVVPYTVIANKPDPEDGQTEVLSDQVLSWIPNPAAVNHDVYLGTNLTSVENATTTNPLGVYQDRQSATSFDPDPHLAPNLTYHWRIDEVLSDNSIIKGKIWHFTTFTDCNGNGNPDQNDIVNGTSQDCNGNGIPDECDIASGTSQDCNGNGIPDECDIASGSSTDVNEDGIPDDCQIDVRIEPVLVAIDPSLTSEERTVLPESITGVVRGSTYYIEIWASDIGDYNTGLTGVYTDVSFCSQTSATALDNGTIYNLFTEGTILSGMVQNFGGATFSGGIGIEPQWVRIGWIEMNANVDIENCTITLAVGATGVAGFDRALIDQEFIKLGSASIQITPPAKSYNLDGEGIIGLGDFSLFVPSWQKSVPPADLEDDFDCDCFVGVGDLSYFATGWMKAPDDPTIIYPPCPDPTCPGAAPQSATAQSAVSKTCSTCLTTGSQNQNQTLESAFEIRVLTSPSASDITTTLPTSVENLQADQTYYLELWTSDIGSINLGLIAAYVDLAFTPGAIDILDIDHNDTFKLFLDGTILTDRIDELGGSYLGIDSGIAIQPDWARVATVRFHANRNCGQFSLLPSTTGVSCYGGPKLSWQNISLSSIMYPHTYDLNCDGHINLLDYAKMAENWHQTAPNLPGDFNLDNTIDLRDLHLLNLHWLTSP